MHFFLVNSLGVESEPVSKGKTPFGDRRYTYNFTHLNFDLSQVFPVSDDGSDQQTRMNKVKMHLQQFKRLQEFNFTVGVADTRSMDELLLRGFIKLEFPPDSCLRGLHERSLGQVRVRAKFHFHGCRLIETKEMKIEDHGCFYAFELPGEEPPTQGGTLVGGLTIVVSLPDNAY